MDVDDDSSVTGEGSVSPSVLTGPFVGRQVFLKKPAKPAVVPAKEPARTLPPTAAEAIAVFTSHRKEVEECVESETEAVVLPTLAVEPSSTGPDRGCADDSKVDEDNAKNTGDEPETADRSVKEEAEEPDEVPAADVLPKKTPAKAPPKPKAPVDPNAPKYARSSYHFFLIELKMKDNGVKVTSHIEIGKFVASNLNNRRKGDRSEPSCGKLSRKKSANRTPRWPSTIKSATQRNLPDTSSRLVQCRRRMAES